MSHLRHSITRPTLPLLLVLCLAALTATSVYAGGEARPLPATTVIGSPDAAVNGKFAVGSASVGSKALTVTGVIDFLGAGTVHNYFTQGGGNNMQITTNVDEANTVGDATRSQWKMVLGSNLDQFSIRRSPAGAIYNEDALFWIDGNSGAVNISTVDTGNGATIPFSPFARLNVVVDSGDAIFAKNYTASGTVDAVHGEVSSTDGIALYGQATSTTGTTYGVAGFSQSTSGRGVFGRAIPSTGVTYGVYGESFSTSGTGVYGHASAASGPTNGVIGEVQSTDGTGVLGSAMATTGFGTGVFGHTSSPNGYAVYGQASATTGGAVGVYGFANSTTGYGVYSEGAMYVAGNFTATGTKSAIVDTKDYGWRTLYAMESPQNWFEDFGQATLTAGEAVVPIEPIFAQTVNLKKTYHVFLTPRGGFCSLYVAETTPTSFTIRALEGDTCEIAFDYRIIAPRLDYEDLRLKPAEDPQAVADSMPPAPEAPLSPATP
jgi:hypothetical protein